MSSKLIIKDKIKKTLLAEVTIDLRATVIYLKNNIE